MAGYASAVRSRLASTYAAALERPEIVERAAGAYARWPEAAEVLGGSLDSLWQMILAPDDSTPRLEHEQKAWLLLHAGLLRGFNLAAITTWRPSADSLPELDGLYPGLVAFGEALHTRRHRTLVVRTARHHADDRRFVESVTAEARSLLRLGLEQGYGLGFLVDAALDGPMVPPDAPAAGVAALLLPLVETTPADDDPGLLAIAESWQGARSHPDRATLLSETLALPRSRRALEEAIGRASRARPLAVPANLGRYSRAFVCTLLAYLLRWWVTVGLRLGLVESDGDVEAPPEAVCHRYPIRHWLAERSIVWAREEVGEVLRLAVEPSSLRWQVVYLAQQYCAVGCRLARALDGE